MSLPHYRYAFLDAQYIMVRNAAKITPYAQSTTYQELVKTFMYSIMKIAREAITFDKLILCWDVRKSDGTYNKNKWIPEYKGTRQSPAEAFQESKAWFESLSNPTDQDRQAWKYALNSWTAYRLREKAKQFIIDNFDKLGIMSIALPGVEADDIACIATDILSEKSDRKSVIISVDSDWDCLVNENIDFYRTKSGELFEYDEVRSKRDNEKVSLYHYKFLEEIFWHSHNGVWNPLAGMKFEDGSIYSFNKVAEAYAQGEMNFINSIPIEWQRSDFIPEGQVQLVRNLAREHIHGLDIRRYDTYLYPIVKSAMESGVIDYTKIDDFCGGFNPGMYKSSRQDYDFSDFAMSINSDKVADFVGGFDKSLFQNVIENDFAGSSMQATTFEDFFGDTKENLF